MLANHRAAKWLTAVAPDANIVARNNSVLGVLHAVKSGMGIAPLPTTIADMEVDLVRVLPPVPELARGWYLLTHPANAAHPRLLRLHDRKAGRGAPDPRGMTMTPTQAEPLLQV
jgi:DNA-binding transcriptional LysR family regulator